MNDKDVDQVVDFAVFAAQFKELRIGDRLRGLEMWRATITGGLAVVVILLGIFSAYALDKLDLAIKTDVRVQLMDQTVKDLVKRNEKNHKGDTP